MRRSDGSRSRGKCRFEFMELCWIGFNIVCFYLFLRFELFCFFWFILCDEIAGFRDVYLFLNLIY